MPGGAGIFQSTVAPENRPKPNRKVVSQPPFFRGELLVSGSVPKFKLQRVIVDFLPWSCRFSSSLVENFEGRPTEKSPVVRLICLTVWANPDHFIQPCWKGWRSRKVLI